MDQNSMRWTRLIVWQLAFCLFVCSQSGCSLFVMAGKMIWGDPMIPSAFRQRTGVNLAKEQKELLVLCSTPASIKLDKPALEIDLTDRVIRRLKRNGINVVAADRVSRWIDDNGGRWDDVSEIAAEFDTDYIAHIELTRMSFRVDSSPQLQRGRAEGNVSVYEVREIGDSKEPIRVFVNEFQTEHPGLHPISVDEVSPDVFEQRFVKHLSTELSHHFNDHRLSDGI